MAFAVGGIESLKEVVKEVKSDGKVSDMELKRVAEAFQNVGFFSKAEASSFLREELESEQWDKIRRSFFAID